MGAPRIDPVEVAVVFLREEIVELVGIVCAQVHLAGQGGSRRQIGAGDTVDINLGKGRTVGGSRAIVLAVLGRGFGAEVR